MTLSIVEEGIKFITRDECLKRYGSLPPQCACPSVMLHDLNCPLQGIQVVGPFVTRAGRPVYRATDEAWAVFSKPESQEFIAKLGDGMWVSYCPGIGNEIGGLAWGYGDIEKELADGTLHPESAKRWLEQQERNRLGKAPEFRVGDVVRYKQDPGLLGVVTAVRPPSPDGKTCELSMGNWSQYAADCELVYRAKDEALRMFERNRAFTEPKLSSGALVAASGAGVFSWVEAAAAFTVAIDRGEAHPESVKRWLQRQEQSKSKPTHTGSWVGRASGRVSLNEALDLAHKPPPGSTHYRCFVGGEVVAAFDASFGWAENGCLVTSGAQLIVGDNGITVTAYVRNNDTAVFAVQGACDRALELELSVYQVANVQETDAERNERLQASGRAPYTGNGTSQPVRWGKVEADRLMLGVESCAVCWRCHDPLNERHDPSADVDGRRYHGSCAAELERLAAREREERPLRTVYAIDPNVEHRQKEDAWLAKGNAHDPSGRNVLRDNDAKMLAENRALFGRVPTRFTADQVPTLPPAPPHPWECQEDY